MDVSIGELARLSGVPVKTIRHYSDIGLVPEASRTPAGYRRYDPDSVARLESVRALRELGVDLDVIRQVTNRQQSLAAVARAHATAIDARIHQLTLRRAVLRVMARGGSGSEEVARLSAYARASADEYRRIMDGFLAAVFADLPDDPFLARMRSGLPELPDEPTEAQIDASVELAALVSDTDFIARVRQMATEGARQRATTGAGEADEATQKVAQAVVERAGEALAAGIRPNSPQAAPIVDQLVGVFASAANREGDAAYRAELADQLDTFGDRRVERYWQLISIINGWPTTPSLMPAYEWLRAGLRAADAAR